jgi:glycosyltransferase involved in cell wall biosynthesis
MAKTAWIISDIFVDENIQPHWRMYAYADVLKGIGYDTVNFFSDDSKLCVLKYKNSKISFIKQMLCIEKPDLAIVYTWCKNLWYLEFLKNNGVQIINRVDSDGRNTFKYHPYDMFKFMTYPQPKIITKIRAVKHFFVRWFFEKQTQIDEMIRSFESTDFITVASFGGLNNFKKTLLKMKRLDLVNKLFYLPNPTSPAFFNKEINGKNHKIISVADWENSITSIWKNKTMLINVIDKYSVKYPKYKFFIVGRGAVKLFKPKFYNKSNVVIVDQIVNEDLPDFMADAKILLITSRREGAPIIVNEALSMGCTIVSTPLPGVNIELENLNWGTIANSFSLKSFLDALDNEIKKWETGKVDYLLGAAKWRDIFSTKSIGNRIEQLINRSENFMENSANL